ncbi:hypothetical protein O7635_18660 [Asanoa sp. WMMD1127]|uniref:hypothetical protein n=1 Tax=Asanoa sp. WMMD1127 TaxID=3016107 RepID=UPI002415A305|nr:hypothetical protein [Asanoa sp. WMMD1127]MDG4823882.1 hypothetical protein [Asanoa sp. WMMD1127]
MNNLDERLADGLHGIVDGEGDSAPPVGTLLERGRRARRRRRSAIAGSTLAVVALAAVGVAAVAQPSPVGERTAAATTPTGSPQLRLASAFETSKDISYRIRVTTGELTYEGAFDPRTDTGYVRVPLDDSVMTELLVDGTRYVGGERPQGELPPDKDGPGETYGRYGQYPGRHDHLSLVAEAGTVLGAAAPDPAALGEALRQADATVTENGDGTLHFAYRVERADGSNAVAGDVTLDADGRIGKVTLTDTWQSTVKNSTGTSTATLDLFDYGVEVRVDRPTDVVPAN